MSVPFHPTLESYDDIASAVMETERGRWFLQEHARRNRVADTAVVLEAIAAAETRLAGYATAGAVDGRDLEMLARRAARLRATLAAIDQPGRLVTQAICQCDKLARAIKRARAGAHDVDETSERPEPAGAEEQPGAAEAAPRSTPRSLRAVGNGAAAPDPASVSPRKLAASDPTIAAGQPPRIAIVSNPRPAEPDGRSGAPPHVAPAAPRPQMPKAWTPGLLDDLSAEETAVVSPT